MIIMLMPNVHMTDRRWARNTFFFQGNIVSCFFKQHWCGGEALLLSRVIQLHKEKVWGIRKEQQTVCYFIWYYFIVTTWDRKRCLWGFLLHWRKITLVTVLLNMGKEGGKKIVFNLSQENVLETDLLTHPSEKKQCQKRAWLAATKFHLCTVSDRSQATRPLLPQKGRKIKPVKQAAQDERTKKSTDTVKKSMERR